MDAIDRTHLGAARILDADAGRDTGAALETTLIPRGLLDVLDSRARLTGFVPKDPDDAGCVIEVRG
jgi:hypothetical protein